MGRIGFVAGFVGGLLISFAVLASPPTLAPVPVEIVGGDAAATCEWPQVVALTLGGTCTATLVHPRLIVYAAHCGTLHTSTSMGEQTDAPARELELLRCERATDVIAVSSIDFAYCELAEPVDDIPIVPMLFGCDESLIEPGQAVTIVGFGLDGDGLLGTKRVAETTIVNVLSLIGIGGIGTGADEGDSGGPALVQLDDGTWRVLGIVSGGGGGGDAVQYVPAPATVEWIEDRSGLDITPCHAADGTWAPTPACGGFYVGSEPGASWDRGCPSMVSGASSDCGDPFDGDPLDEIEPVVSVISPSAGMQFDEPALLAVDVEASDAQWGVMEVRLELDGVAWLDGEERPARDQVPPYAFDSMAIAEAGEHEIVAVAEDWAGNVSLSEPVLIQVGELPDTESGEGSSDSESTDTGDTSGGADEDASSSCACASTDAGPSGLILFGLLALIRRPRGRPRRCRAATR